MAKVIGKLATRYAKALLAAVIKEKGRTSSSVTPAQKAAQELKAFALLWARESRFSASIQNPMFKKSERENALKEIARNCGLEDVLVRFLQVCFEHDRISELPEIAEAFLEAADKDAGLQRVEITTAREISSDEKSSIENSLLQHLNGSLSFTWKEDSSILGGLIVRYGGKVLDGSLGGKLERVEHRLRNAS